MRKSILTALATSGAVVGLGAWWLGAAAAPASLSAGVRPDPTLPVPILQALASSTSKATQVLEVSPGAWTAMGNSGVSMRLTNDSMCVAPAEDAPKDLVQDMPDACVDVADPNLDLTGRGHVYMRAAWGNEQVFYGIASVSAAAVEVKSENGSPTLGQVLEVPGASYRAFFVVTAWKPYTISEDSPMPPIYSMQMFDKSGTPLLAG